MQIPMKKSGAWLLALALGGLPLIALAEDAVGEEDIQVQANVGRQEVVAQEAQVRPVESRESDEESGPDEQEISIEQEDDSNPAVSLDDLKQKIEERKQQLEQEAASSTPADRDALEDANPVRLAVHSLLASRELLGGIGPQVSQIAKEMNDSVATTTNVEAKLASRGFFMRLLFGGDSSAAEVISEEVAKNQERIDELTKLIGEANVPTNVQAVLQAQITALEDAQTRFQELAQKEQNQWGLFSWRFFRK